jgi:hypothetical protein
MSYRDKSVDTDGSLLCCDTYASINNVFREMNPREQGRRMPFGSEILAKPPYCTKVPNGKQVLACGRDRVYHLAGYLVSDHFLEFIV